MPAPFSGVGDPPFNDTWIERHFQESHEFFDLRSGVMSRSIPPGRQNWRYGMLILGLRRAVRVSIWWTHGHLQRKVL